MVANAVATAEVLLKAGADANAKTAEGLTPLHVAVGKNAFATAEVLDRYASATAEVLPQAGVDVNAKDNDGFTSLHHAAAANDFSRAEVLLKAGAGVNAKGDEGLYAAAPCGGEECFCDG